jgi:hypothetical protein
LQVQDIRWVVIAYVLTYASLMLVFGSSATCWVTAASSSSGSW